MLRVSLPSILFNLLLQLKQVVTPLSVRKLKPCLSVLSASLGSPQLSLKLFDLGVWLILLRCHVFGLESPQILQLVLLVPAHLLEVALGNVELSEVPLLLGLLLVQGRFQVTEDLLGPLGQQPHASLCLLDHELICLNSLVVLEVD